MTGPLQSTSVVEPEVSTWRYRISGLEVSSDLVLPAIPTQAVDPSDVTIRRGRVAPDLDDATKRGPNWAMNDDGFLLRVPGVARFLISRGRNITYETDSTAKPRDAVIFLVGSVFGILLHQRGDLVLHASAMSIGGQAMLFCGPSGAGKSTVAAALAATGHDFLTDDVCRVIFDDHDRPIVLPDGKMIKLWHDVLEAFSTPMTCVGPVKADIPKYYVEPPTTSGPLRPAAVYVLRRSSQPTASIDVTTLAKAIDELRLNAYRPFILEVMEQAPRYFMDSAKLLSCARVFRLSMPDRLAALPAVVDAVEQHACSLDTLR